MVYTPSSQAYVCLYYTQLGGTDTRHKLVCLRRLGRLYVLRVCTTAYRVRQLMLVNWECRLLVLAFPPSLSEIVQHLASGHQMTHFLISFLFDVFLMLSEYKQRQVSLIGTLSRDVIYTYHFVLCTEGDIIYIFSQGLMANHIRFILTE